MSEKNRHGSPNGRAVLVEARIISERGRCCKRGVWASRPQFCPNSALVASRSWA